MNPPSAGPLTIPSTRDDRADLLEALEADLLDPTHPCYRTRAIARTILRAERQMIQGRRLARGVGAVIRAGEPEEDVDEEIRLSHLAQDATDAEQSAALFRRFAVIHECLPELDGAA